MLPSHSGSVSDVMLTTVTEEAAMMDNSGQSDVSKKDLQEECSSPVRKKSLADRRPVGLRLQPLSPSPSDSECLTDSTTKRDVKPLDLGFRNMKHTVKTGLVKRGLSIRNS